MTTVGRHRATRTRRSGIVIVTMAIVTSVLVVAVLALLAPRSPASPAPSMEPSGAGIVDSHGDPLPPHFGFLSSDSETGG